MRHYRDHFNGKVVYCNCDDPTVSNFFKYFSLKFADLGLKKLITTCYKNQNPDLFSAHDTERAIKLEYDGFREGDHVPNAEDIGITHLKGDGDFRSQEGIDILKQADIVVTNPPFSLFREYVNQLVEHGKSFIVLGNVNALKYRDVFPHFMADRLWLGPSISSGDREFGVPDDYPLEAAPCQVDADGNKFIRVKGVRWFANIDHEKHHEDLIPYERYTSEKYPKYENFDAINVDWTKNIPEAYDGVTGVPITFMDKYNPDQFEILGIGIAGLGVSAGVKPYKPEPKHYRKTVQKRGAVDGDLYMLVDGEVKVPYSRILIGARKTSHEN